MEICEQHHELAQPLFLLFSNKEEVSQNFYVLFVVFLGRIWKIDTSTNFFVKENKWRQSGECDVFFNTWFSSLLFFNFRLLLPRKWYLFILHNKAHLCLMFLLSSWKRPWKVSKIFKPATHFVKESLEDQEHMSLD